jgi:hypothetical protein
MDLCVQVATENVDAVEIVDDTEISFSSVNICTISASFRSGVCISRNKA